MKDVKQGAVSFLSRATQPITQCRSAGLSVRNKYASLIVDISNADYKVDLFCFEVSVRGQITKDNFARLRSFLYKIVGQSKLASLISKNVSKAAILGSFSIFAARNEQNWSAGSDLSVQL